MTTTKNRKLLIYLITVAIGMFAFGYALVPIYNVLCKVTGLNGKISGPSGASEFIDKTRTVTVEFTATGNANIAFQFYPLVKKIRVHPGENTRLAFLLKMIIQRIW